MALGSGIYTYKNKVLPGTYINFTDSIGYNNIITRGVATTPLFLDWCQEDKIFKIEKDDFINNSLYILGYEYNHNNLKSIRDIFKNCNTLYVYRLNGNGEKASNEFATAKYSGIRGNDIRILIENVSNNKYNVSTLLDNITVDTQTITSLTELVNNDFVDFKTDFELSVVLGKPLTGGTNSLVTIDNHIKYLRLIDKYYYNVMCSNTTENIIKQLYVDFVKDMRENIGLKFQLVLHNFHADYEGVVNVKNNSILNIDTEIVKSTYRSLSVYNHKDLNVYIHETIGINDIDGTGDLVYWVAGVIGGCDINKSNVNKVYDGEFEINIDFEQEELKDAINKGEFVLHKLNYDIRVLQDINSFITFNDDKGELFKDNQTIRIIDQIATDISNMFTEKYLGNIQNNISGRIGLWSDIVKHHGNLQVMGAIENFDEKEVVVSASKNKKEVVISDTITVLGSTKQIYMTIIVS